jgi:hypothetical protein
MNNTKLKKRKGKIMQRIKRRFSRNPKPVPKIPTLNLQRDYKWAIDMLKKAFGERVKFYKGELYSKSCFTCKIEGEKEKEKYPGVELLKNVCILLEGSAEVKVNLPRQTRTDYIFPYYLTHFSFNDYAQKEKVLGDYITYLKKIGFTKPKIESAKLNEAKQEMKKKEAKFDR